MWLWDRKFESHRLTFSIFFFSSAPSSFLTPPPPPLSPFLLFFFLLLIPRHFSDTHSLSLPLLFHPFPFLHLFSSFFLLLFLRLIFLFILFFLLLFSFSSSYSFLLLCLPSITLPLHLHIHFFLLLLFTITTSIYKSGRINATFSIYKLCFKFPPREEGESERGVFPTPHSSPLSPLRWWWCSVGPCPSVV